MLASAAGALALFVAVWLASLVVADASIVDVFWGVGFIVVGWICFAVGHGAHDRRLLLAVLVSVWGGRLALHIGARNRGKGEDRRYVEMRERDGSRFWLTSLYRVFGVQAVVLWLISLPLQAGGSLGGGLQRQRDHPQHDRLDCEHAVEAGQPEARAVALTHLDVTAVLALAEVAGTDVRRETAAPDGHEQRKQQAAVVCAVADCEAHPADHDEPDAPEHVDDRRVLHD